MTNAKNTVATMPTERFESPRPAFPAPANAALMTSEKRDSTPAKPLEQRAQEGDKLANFIQEAEKKAQLAAAQAQARREGRTVPSAPRKSKKIGPVTHTVIAGPFTPEDVCKDNKEFIVRTRGSDIHTPEMKALFWANGGEAYMKAGLGYAAAFSNLRSDKQKAIKGGK